MVRAHLLHVAGNLPPPLPRPHWRRQANDFACLNFLLSIDAFSKTPKLETEFLRSNTGLIKKPKLNVIGRSRWLLGHEPNGHREHRPVWSSALGAHQRKWNPLETLGISTQRQTHNPEVVGSNPTPATNFSSVETTTRPHSSLLRAAFVFETTTGPHPSR